MALVRYAALNSRRWIFVVNLRSSMTAATAVVASVDSVDPDAVTLHASTLVHAVEADIDSRSANTSWPLYSLHCLQVSIRQTACVDLRTKDGVRNICAAAKPARKQKMNDIE